MNIKKSKKLALTLIYPFSKFKDFRGTFIETFNKKKWNEKFKINFLEEDNVISKKNVFRGIHGYKKKVWRLVSCTHGKVLCIVFNLNPNSKNFGCNEKFILQNCNFQILIPPLYGNSYLVLSDKACYHYKQSVSYNGINSQFTFNIKDPFFKIKLPKKKIILSKRDREAKFIDQ